MKISFIVPVYNEEERISDLYSELREVIEREPWDAEVIMVDDGSVDQSAKIIANIAKDDPPIRLVRLPQPRSTHVAPASEACNMSAGSERSASCRHSSVKW